uniref:Arf-GAP domain-containing protein n=1 Tax=Graphocephala atropunctata TaxID=36148 RepID=A0A1B6MAI2_9HEMI
MSSKAEKERQKQIQDKCQTLLTQMLRDEDNKYCVDCDAKGPRWASWNLGIFLCIRCAGIHRNLGVHISKVKSVNLDSWTPEQVVSLQQMGNSRARAVYEANLPDNFRRPQTDTALEAFVRAKYEAKKYIAREWVPPPLPKVNWDKELDEEAERAKKKKRESKLSTTPVTSSGRKVLDNVIPQPLPKPSTSPKPQRTSHPVIATATSTQPSADLLGLDTPLQESSPAMSSAAADDFSSFLSAPPPAPAVPPTGAPTHRSAEEDSFFNQPQSSPAPSGKLTTDSILALYGKSQPPPAAPSHAFPIQGGFMPVAPGAGFQQSPFGVPNGMIPSTQIPVPVQGGMFPPMGVAAPPTNINPASNPFYNMAPTQSVPPTFPQGTRMTQQMSGLNLGVNMVPANPYQPTMPPPLWQ